MGFVVSFGLSPLHMPRVYSLPRETGHGNCSGIPCRDKLASSQRGEDPPSPPPPSPSLLSFCYSVDLHGGCCLRSLCTPSLLTVREYLQIPQRIFPGFPTCCRRSHSPPSNFTPKHTPTHYAILHAPRLAVHSPRVGGGRGE